MSDNTSAVPEGGPDTPPISDEQAREYMRRLRTVPAEQLVSELLSGLLNAAQVKLGRKDARLLIDLSGLLLEHTRRYLPADMTTQVDQILAELRLGQVRAESATSGPAEANDLADTPAPPGTASAPAAEASSSAQSVSAQSASAQPPSAASPPTGSPPPAPSGGAAASRLWLPGRDF